MDDFTLEPIHKLTRDLRQAAATLTETEARYLVDSYYQMQRDRIRAAHQARTLNESAEPHLLVGWLAKNAFVLERNIKSALAAYSKAHPVGRWAESIVGIGPVISAGLLAHITLQPWRCMNPKGPKTRKTDDGKVDFCREGSPCTAACTRTRTTTVGKIWRFAGLDPTVKWEPGTKRPWNGALKRLCWLIGESFTKVSGNDNDFYGKFYLQRKAQEEAKNAAGAFAEQARVSLETKKWRRDTSTRVAYEAGRLPQARIHLRAQRYAVKLFLSHWHAVHYFHLFREMPPKPYVIEHLGHADLIEVPHWPF
jgi:hypothetical protein